MKNKRFLPDLGVGGVLIVTLAVTLVWSAAFAARAAESATESAVGGPTLTWTPIWTTNAPALNHATAALMAGRYDRAIHFAAKARPATPAERAVTAQNLCLAYVGKGAAARAEAHCRAALHADDAPVVWKHGGATIGNPAAVAQDRARDTGTAGLRALLHANIAQAYGRAAVNRIVVANATHPTP